MKKFLSVKIIAIMFALFTLLSGSFMLNFKPAQVSADATTTDGIDFTAKVVERNLDADGNNIFYAEKLESLDNGKNLTNESSYIKKYSANANQKNNYKNENSYIQEIALDKYTMLTHSSSEKTIQNAYISFGYQNALNVANESITGAKVYLYELTVGITLNGNPLYVREVETLSTQDHNAKYYQHYFDLQYNEMSNGTAIEGFNNQGEYIFTFTYRTINTENKSLSASKTVNFKFNLLDQQYYAEELEHFNSSYKANSEDKEKNHAALDKKDYVYAPYLSNTNEYYTIEDLNEDIYGLKNDTKFYTYYNYSDRNATPNLTFNPEKFSVSVTRNYFTHSSTFKLGNGINNLPNERYYGVSVGINDSLITLNFLDLGVYTISYEYIYNGIVMSNSNSQRMLICGEELSIFGTQIYYAKDTTGEDEFYTNGKSAYTNIGDVNIDDDTNDDIGKVNIANIASTNQAPVWFKVLGNLHSDSRYYEVDNSGNYNENNSITFINGKKFTDSGIYLVNIKYTYSEYSLVSNSSSALEQWFLFKIENTTPSLSVRVEVKENTYTYLSNNDYTNKAVEINVDSNSKPGAFDSDVILRIYNTNNQENSNNYTLLNEINGYSNIENLSPIDVNDNESITYAVRLYYGAKIGGVQTTYTEIKFTIDKIKPTIKLNGEELTESIVAHPGNASYKVTSEDADKKEFIYKFARLKQNSDVKVELIEDTYLTNGYEFESFSSSIEYNNQEFSEHGVYLFCFTDLAGNSTTRVIVLDNSSPAITQIPAQEANNPFNVFSENVTVTSGEYKAIKADNIINNLNTEDYKLENYGFDNNLYYTKLNTDSTYIKAIDETKNDVQVFENNSSSSYNGIFKNLELISPNPEDEEAYYYDVTISDILNNNFEKRIEINMDKCKGNIIGIVYENNTAVNLPEETSFSRIYNNNATNLREIQFSFLLGEEDYAVKELTFTYYPFSYDTASEYYPFANKPTREKVSLLEDIIPNDITGETNKYVTSIINPTYSSTFEADITAPGYYIISRKYAKTASAEKHYCFIVDRNNIKSNPVYANNETSYDWGEDIYFNLNNEGKTYTSFISNVSNNPTYIPTKNLISTNKLPAVLNLPDFKYNKNAGTEKIGNTDTLLKDVVNLNVSSEIHIQYKDNETPKYDFFKLFEINQEKQEIVYYDYSNFDGNGAPINDYDNADCTIYKFANGKLNAESLILNGVSVTNFESFKLACLTFINASIYRVVISDSTASNIASGSDKTYGNTLIFQFEIQHNAPSGEWESVNNNYTDTYSILDTNENSVNFTFSVLNDVTKAKIDISNISLYQIVNNQRINIPVTEKDLVITENSSETTYVLTNLDTTSECVYELTIQYEGDESNYIVNANTEQEVNYFKQTYYLIVDKTKPNYTVSSLIQKDNYKNKDSYISVNNKGEYSVSEDYFFVVDSNYTFSECSNDYILNLDKYSYFNNFENQDFINTLKKTETNTEFYYRQYNKYNVGETNLTSILPDNPNYSNYNVERDRPRFNANNSNYKTLGYQNSLANLEPNRFYEIIEVDGANNYSSFTIFLTDNKTVTLDYTSNSAENALVTLPYDNNTESSDINVATLIINKLSYINENVISDMFYSVEVIVNNSNSLMVNFTKDDFNLNYNVNGSQTYADFTQLENSASIKKINDYIQSYLKTEDVIINGASIKIKVYSRFNSINDNFDEINYNFKIQGTAKLQLEYQKNYKNNELIDIIIPASTISTYITELQVYEVVNGVKQSEYIYTSLTDANYAGGFNFNTNTVLTLSQLSSSKVYVVDYTDNFGYKQSLIIYFDYEPDNVNERLSYNYDKSQTVNGIVNTSDVVTFTYQSNLYSVKLFINNIETDINGFISSTLDNGKVTLKFNPVLDYKTINNYKINVYSVFDSEDSNSVNYEFIINTKLPNIQLKDFLDNVLLDAEDKDSNLNTSQKVYIHWDTTVTDFAPTFSVSYTGESGNATFTMFELINGKSCFENIGTYTITQTNQLNNTRIITFHIIDDVNLFYWIEENSTKDMLTASEYKYKYKEDYITVFNTNLSINEYSVIANIDKNLYSEYVETITENGVNIAIFRIYGTSTHVYETYIAVASIPSTSLILTNAGFKINGASSSANPYSSYGINGVVTLTWNAYHLISSNPITAYVSYNNSDFKKLTDYTTNESEQLTSLTCSTSLTVGGNYKFYFIDDAGNRHVFNYNSVNQSSILDINLINNVWLNIKGEDESIFRNVINYEVFNKSVQVQYYGNEYLANGSLTYSVLKNGVEMNVQVINKTLTFSQTGFYSVTFTALENVSGLENEVSTTIHFTILNNKEARTAYNYSTANAQQIYKVEKLVGEYYEDITDEILELNNISSISNLFITSFAIGVGKYNIYVQDTSNPLIGNQEFMFNVWINNEKPVLVMSRDFGTSDTSKVTIQINKSLIYSQIGKCRIVISNFGFIDIDETAINEVTTIQLTSVADYYISIVSESGQVLFSNKITITEGLNDVAILVIVLVVIILAVAIFIFWKLRTRMKVR